MLLLDKPAGPTSHDVVSTVRRSLGTRRVGHAGTLDPGATGLLVVLVGRATRLARFIALLPKRYIGTVRFGFETTTDDAEGEPLGGRDETWRIKGAGEIAAALGRVAAQPTQLPPPVSAKKVAGQRAYRLARRGEMLQLAPVPVTIYGLQAAAWDTFNGELAIDVRCSAGTYVRAIARDVGRALGTKAHLKDLRRVEIGSWSLRGTIGLEAFQSHVAPALLLRPMAEAVAHLPLIEVGPDAGRRFRHGQKIEASALYEGWVSVYSEGELLGVAEFRDGLYKPVVGLAS